MAFRWILLFVGLTGCFCVDVGAPKLEVANPELGYHGLVKEDERIVEVKPHIRAIGAPVCSFRIVNKHHGEAPFEVRLVDKSSGQAQLLAKKELNCEKRKNYKFDIAAVGCDGKLSDNVTVHVSVMDVNEFEPSFVDPSYVVQVDEGRLYDSIVQVEAEDDDCSPRFGDICKYEILTADQPFAIDAEGKIKNTEPLEWEKSRNYILSIVAYDCGMRRSKPVLVTIKVNRVCRLGWKEVPERIEYVPGSGPQPLFPRARLDLCDVPCHVEKVSTQVTVATHHIGKGCDRDTYSVDSQRKLCGASAESVDLLPAPGIGAEWTRNLPTDDGHESDQIYEFDGTTNAVVIPPSTMPHNLTENFTISTWMKHARIGEQLNSHIKENILCSADDHNKSRPHYSLFVRNCRLIFLLRRDFTEENLNTFRPAEWRWKMPQVCDDEWHHYAVSVRFPEVILFVDGQRFPEDQKNPEIIDDWPLHPTKGINTTLVVGACWKGSESKMANHFKGFLAGLSVLRGKTEKPEVLTCLHKCKESLEPPSVVYLEPGMQLMSNTELTEVTVLGNNKTNLEALLRRVAYTNSREFPTQGRRNLRLTTTVQCDNGKSIKVPALDGYVLVLPQEQPVITINGTSNIFPTYEECSRGVKIFFTTTIGVSVRTQDDEESVDDDTTPSSYERKIDSCTISVYPPLNPDHEHFRLPENEMARMGITYKATKDGIIISGTDMVYHYEDIVRHIHYSNRKPAYYLNRTFKLVCSELNGRFVSNEYVQTVTILHPQATKASKQVQPSHAKVDKHHVELVASQPVGKMSYLQTNVLDTSEAIALSSASHTVTIIIVVCVGFLVFMIVLGVIRIRAAHQRAQESRDEDQEMAWDDSSLTITINPMDQIEVEERETQPLHDDDSDSSEDGSSYRDELESSEDEAEKVKDRELEWDDSTLTF